MPTRSSRLVRIPKSPHIPTRFQREFRAYVIPCQCADLGDDIRVTRIERVGGAEAERGLEAGRDEIDRDDGRYAEMGSSKDAGHPDGTETVDGDGGVGGRFEPVEYGASAKREGDENDRRSIVCQTRTLSSSRIREEPASPDLYHQELLHTVFRPQDNLSMHSRRRSKKTTYRRFADQRHSSHRTLSKESTMDSLFPGNHHRPRSIPDCNTSEPSEIHGLPTGTH